MFSAKSWRTNFWMLEDILSPSSMAFKMEAKLSSVKIMSEASLATSEPFIPIAIPTSAFFNEGESLTPSPVMAQNLSRRCKASIISTLVCGAHSAITNGNTGKASISSSLNLSKSVAVMTMRSTTSLV